MAGGEPSADFGFASQTNLAGLETGEGSAAAPAEGSVVDPAADSDDPSAETVAAAEAELPAETATASAGADTSVEGTTAASPIAAQVATATNATTSSTPPAAIAFAAPAPNRSDRSLYASLFTEAEARTPIKNTDAAKASRVVVTRTDGVGKPQRDASLPGVDPSSLFQIGQRASAEDEDLLEDIGGSYQVASLSGMARLAPNGLLVQRDDIVTNCFGTELVSVLRQIERRFAKKVVITSGYRSPQHNRRVNGAKASMHMACKAADLHVPGVDGKQVAAYVRSLPGRGGVGTYCHTAAIHVDVGPKRDWNWACRRRQKS